MERDGPQTRADACQLRGCASWRFGDAVFGWNYDFFADGSKVRRAGFHEYVDTEEMFRGIFEDFRRRKMIPTI